jgi:dinuclear metal center YbgI/SA1388 family protein
MATIKHKQPCLNDLIRVMERLAPAVLAETWDNCGLQIGAGHWPISKVWVALDPLGHIVSAAIQEHVDLLIPHHPLFFRPLQQLDLATAAGRIIESAIMSHLAIYSAHTNLDSTLDGINDLLAQKAGLQHLTALQPFKEPVAVNGTIIDAQQLGLGRVGVFATPVPVAVLVARLKKEFGLPSIRVAGNMDQTVRSAAVCSGSGGSLIESFLKTDAQVYISGDLRFHEARTIEDAGRTLIDLGHFASENIVVDSLVGRLSQAAQQAGWDLQIEPCRIEQDPFHYL